MTIEVANKCIQNAKHYGDWTPFEEALVTLIMDLQVRHVEALTRIDKLEDLHQDLSSMQPGSHT